MQEDIDYSSPDDGLGDPLRNAFIKVQNNFTELYNGKVDKITGKGLSENDFTDADKAKLDGIEVGAQVNVQADWGETDTLADSFILNKPPSLYSAFGYFHVSDLATQTTPLAFVASTPLQLTNDNAGAFTSEAHAPYGVPQIWNTSTNSLDFTHLSVGDAVLVRTDLLISTTSVNQNLRLYIKFGVGTPSEYDLLIDSWNEKSVVTFEEFIKDVSFSIDNEDWRDAPAKIYILSDDDGSVKVNGWYIPIIRKSLNIIDFNSDPLKLDKVLTSGVERAYIINADGSQGTKATSDFKDVLEFADLASFPLIGESGKIYIDLATNLQYRWSGSAYISFSAKEKVIFYNRSQWTFPNVAGAPFPLISSTNFELSTANLNSTTDNALTAMGITPVIFMPIGIAPFGMKLKRVILEGRQTFASWQGFNLRCVVGSNRTVQTTPSGPASTYSHLDSQVVEDFTHVAPISGNLYVNHEVTSSVVVPQNHGVILMLSYSRTGTAISPVISTYLEFEIE